MKELEEILSAGPAAMNISVEQLAKQVRLVFVERIDACYGRVCLHRFFFLRVNCFVFFSSLEESVSPPQKKQVFVR